jgi:hypothetical protein
MTRAIEWFTKCNDKNTVQVKRWDSSLKWSRVVIVDTIPEVPCQLYWGTLSTCQRSIYKNTCKRRTWYLWVTGELRAKKSDWIGINVLRQLWLCLNLWIPLCTSDLIYIFCY